MPHDRFFVDTSFEVDAECELLDDEAHHLRVMRKQAHEQVELVNGLSQLAYAKILSITKKSAHLKIQTIQTQEPLPLKIILCQAIARPNRLETIVEKAVELGVSELWLIPCDLSEKKELSASFMTRLKNIAISAMKQCGRLDLPRIVLKPEPLKRWPSLPFPSYFGDPHPKAPSLFQAYQKESPLLFFIGPESGFSEEETQHLITLHAKGVHLHPHVLRTDTAAITALALLFAAFSCSQ